MEYSGLENVYLNGSMIGFSREEIDEKLDAILSFADIGEFIHQPVKTYSSGMFVRLAFAVAINIEPEILIVDEALSVGDVFFQSKCYHKFEEFKKMGKTILFVSHDLGSIGKYCDRVILLNQGNKIAEGSAKEMVDLYKKVLVHQEDQPDHQEQQAALEAAWDKPFQLNPNMQEYGNKKAEIIDFSLLDEKGRTTNTIEKFTEFTIKMKILFHETISEPIFAFTIKDLKGTDITGTNTMVEKIHIPDHKPGETQEISFTQKMNLQGGEYLLSLGCTGYEEGEFVVYHRKYEICNISVISSKNTVGFYDMDSDIQLL
jgi:teichoic acid transport system ATP-binding protein